MGQLEKYGLYVMCLVIFLILGVTLWGEPANATRRVTRQQAVASVGGSGPMEASLRGGAQPPLHELLRPEEPRRRATSASLLEGDAPTERPAQPSLPEQDDAPSAPAAPAPPQQPAARAKYTVKKGDLISRIAQRQLGSARYQGRILELNPDVDPDRMQVGTVLTLPAPAEVASAAPRKDAVASGDYSTYRIRKGDTLQTIANRQLGATKRWVELRKLNPNVDPQRMQIGITIKLPLK